MRLGIVLVLVTACGGGKDGDSGAPVVDNTSCRDSWASAPLGSVPAEDWPAGLSTSIPLLPELDGLWTATECGDTDEQVDLKIVVPSQDDMLVYTSTPAGNPPCGCDNDPEYTADNGYLPVARLDVDVFVEDFHDYAMDAQNFTVPFLFFQDGQRLKARGCTRVRIDPDLDDNWTYGTLIVRLEAGNVLSGAIVLESAAGTTEQCAFTQWEGR